MFRGLFSSFAAVLFFVTLHTAQAQQQETLFDAPIDHGGYGAVVMKFTPVREEMAMMMGGYGGWLIDHQLMLGVGGYGLVTNVRASSVSEALYSRFNEPLYVNFAYGGFVTEFTVAPTKLVHGTVQLLVGAGGVEHRDDWYDNMLDDDGPAGRRYGPVDAVFVLEPSFNVEMNVTTWFRVAAGGSYRYVSGMDEIVGLDNKDLSGPSGSLTLKFGAF